MTELMSPSDFRVALEEAFSGTMAKDASFSRAWATGKLEKHHFVHWATNHYHYVGPFGDYLGLMYANTPDHARDAKDFLLQNMYEEELSDDRHTDLLIRFAEACGGTREYVQNRKNAMPFTKGLQGWMYHVSGTENFVVSSAALIVGLESQVPSIYRTQYPTLINKYGFSEWEAEFFDLHITSDEIHGERGYQIVLKYADTRALQQRSLDYVREAADMRFAYTKSLYETYVEPDLGPWIETEETRAGARRLTRFVLASGAEPDGLTGVPRIFFKTTDRSVEFAEGDEVNLLRISIRADCGVPWKCASGNCGTDRLLVEEGAENLDPPRRRERERLGELLEQGYRLGCQTYTRGDVTVSWDPDQKGLDEDSAAGKRLTAKWLGAADTD